MHEYKTARSIFGFMEFCSWALVVVGVIVFLAGFAGGRALAGAAGMVGALPGLLMVFVGILSVMLVQIGRAAVDTAEMTGKLLNNSTEELAILKAQNARSLAQSGGMAKTVETPPAAVKSAPPATPVPSSVRDEQPRERPVAPTPAREAVAPPATNERIEPVFSTPASAERKLLHNGKTIRITDDGAFVGMLRFNDVEPAKVFIDETLIPSERGEQR